MDSNLLINAVKEGNEREVQRLIEQGADVTILDAQQQTALDHAVFAGNLTCARLLLAHGAKSSPHAVSPLYGAISYKNKAMVELLVEAGAVLDAKLITHAALEGQAEILEYLLDKGCPADNLSGDKGTCLHYLARFGPAHARPFSAETTARLVRKCVNAGANPEHVDNFKDTPLMCAARMGNPAMVEALLQAGVNPGFSIEGRTAISQAKNKNVIKLLMQAGVPSSQIRAAVEERMLAGEERVANDLAPLLKDADNDVLRQELDLLTACRYMPWKEFEAIVRRHAHTPAMTRFGVVVLYKCMKWTKGVRQKVALLLECGAAPQGDFWGYPLVRAVEIGKAGVVDMLFAHGADPNVGKGHVTPLLAALAINRMYDDRTQPAKKFQAHVGKLLDKLVRAGANPSAQGYDGFTPLFVAMKMYPKHVEQLLQLGADPNTANKYGHTPLMHAAIAEARLLVDAGADVMARTGKGMTALHLAATTSKAQLLLKHGADAHAQDEDGNTPLLTQAAAGRLSVVKLLAKRKNVALAVNKHGDNSLLRVLTGIKDDEPMLELCEFLYSKGANALQINAQGQSLLIKACVHNKPKVAAWALDKGCDVNHQDAHGMRGLEYAEKWGYHELKSLLLARGAN